MVPQKMDYMVGAEGFQGAVSFVLQACVYVKETGRERRHDGG